MRPARTKSSRNPISKITRTKWMGGVAHAVALSSNPNPTKKQTNNNKKEYV
jgi:hypothetical protein